MAQPSSRQELIDYCKRKLGHPVLEINIADEQVEDLVDDTIQLFQERHFDGVYQTYMKYQVSQADIDRGRATGFSGPGVSSTSVTENIVGTATPFNYYENSNYLKVPSYVIGINKIYQFEASNAFSSGMFSVKYQLFLNDLYYWGSMELLTYAMVKRQLEDIDWLLTTQKQIRFNKRQDRLYMDIDWSSLTVGQYLVIDCYRVLDPGDYDRVWNDSFIKPYLTALMKRQWGYNISNKFKGMKLPGGVELDGRTLVDDAQRELDVLTDKMSTTYELPPMDMIG
jgi:hypothetical protein